MDRFAEGLGLDSSILCIHSEDQEEEQGQDKSRPVLTTHPGIRYQLLMLTELFLRAGIAGKKFELASENAKALDFDDIVARFQNYNEYRNDFFQVKYINDDKEKIKLADFLSSAKESKFGLAKYFLDFIQIRSIPDFRDDNLEAFTICTNVDFDEKLRDDHVVQKDGELYKIDLGVLLKVECKQKDFFTTFQEALKKCSIRT